MTEFLLKFPNRSSWHTMVCTSSGLGCMDFTFWCVLTSLNEFSGYVCPFSKHIQSQKTDQLSLFIYVLINQVSLGNYPHFAVHWRKSHSVWVFQNLPQSQNNGKRKCNTTKFSSLIATQKLTIEMHWSYKTHKKSICLQAISTSLLFNMKTLLLTMLMLKNVWPLNALSM